MKGLLLTAALAGSGSVFGRRWRIASISPRSIREPRRARSDDGKMDITE